MAARAEIGEATVRTYAVLLFGLLACFLWLIVIMAARAESEAIRSATRFPVFLQII